MKFDTPAGTNPIDQLKVVGQPVNRVDGWLKTTGTARYAYERHDIAPHAAYGFLFGSGVAKGRIRKIDVRRARRAAGVLAVVTAESAGKLTKVERNTVKLVGGPQIDHYHQAVALVVAETFEQARAAAELLNIEYESAPGAYDLEQAKAAGAGKPKDITGGPADSSVGSFDDAFVSASVQVDATYTTPGQSHAMMEPHATTAAWKGDELTLWTSHQMVDWCRVDLAKTLGVPKEKVRVVSPFIGGGFGSKLFVRADALFAALGARAVRRPVKVTMQRALIINNTTHRPATIQRLRIGATRDGVITAIGHELWSGDQPGGKPDGAVQQTRMLYAGANRMTMSRIAVIELPEANAMRAPGEATGHMALEIAMDEVAEKLGMDPVEFRLRNDAQVVPDPPPPKPKGDSKGKAPPPANDGPKQGPPFSQRHLAECLRQGAERFGWNKRNARPAQSREGPWLIGMGMASAYRGAPTTKSAARVRLGTDGVLTVETDMTDIGTGSYTIIAQTAAEMLGLPLSRVKVRLGDSNFPVSSGSGGQWGAASSTAGVYAACMKLREAIVSQLGIDAAQAQFADGQVSAGGHSTPLAQVAAPNGLVAEDLIEFGDLDKKFEHASFGAHFVEVAVNRFTAEIRVRRMLAVCGAGRILNPKSARSQVIGAMTMGVGAAIMEELAVDTRHGFFVNHDLAGYEVPVHADIPHQEVIFLDEVDPTASPMKAKGVGELGLCGVGAAVANAIYNATGVRVRDYPVTLDKLLAGMPSASAS